MSKTGIALVAINEITSKSLTKMNYLLKFTNAAEK